MKLRLCFSVATALLSCGLSANADIATTSSTDGTVATSSSNTDLFETNLLSSTFPVGNNIANGSTGTNGEDSALNPAVVVVPGTFDFVLDTSVNTFGYDIESLAVYSGWIDARAGQQYSVSFSTVGSDVFTDLLTVDQTAANTSLVTTSVDTLGLLASGVDVIRFDIGLSSGVESVYREIDAIGTATTAVPEPASLTLLGLGALGLIGRRRR